MTIIIIIRNISIAPLLTRARGALQALTHAHTNARTHKSHTQPSSSPTVMVHLVQRPQYKSGSSKRIWKTPRNLNSEAAEKVSSTQRERSKQKSDGRKTLWRQKGRKIFCHQKENGGVLTECTGQEDCSDKMERYQKQNWKRYTQACILCGILWGANAMTSNGMKYAHFWVFSGSSERHCSALSVTFGSGTEGNRTRENCSSRV